MADLNKKEIEELRRLINLLGKDIKGVDFDTLIKSGNAANTVLNSLRKEAEEFTSDISYAAEGFRKIVEEINNTNVGIKEANKAFNKLSSIADKVQYHQKEISKLSKEEAENLSKQVLQERARLATASNLLENKIGELNLVAKANEKEIRDLLFKNNKSKDELKLLAEAISKRKELNKDLTKSEIAQRNIIGTLKDEDALFNGLISSIDKINNEIDEENKKLGLTKTALDGINKIPFLNGVVNANEALDLAKEKIKEGGSRTQAFGAAFSSVGKQIKTHLSDPLAVTGFLVTELISTFKSVDSAIGDLAKGFDLTYNGATNLRMELTDIANLSGDVAVTTKGLQESMMAVGQVLGSNARLNKEDLITFTKLREQAGYTNDELAGIQKLTLATGGSLEDNTASFLGSVAALNGQNKLTINAKQLLKEVANVSDSIKLSIGGTTEKLAEAAFKAKQFGINLEQADQISQSLLDFESSIGNELSAELITGKDLNLEKARLLAINGDIAGAGAEILKQVGGTAEFTKMNRIQQEALAKATGLTRDDLAKSLMDKEALVALSGVEGKDAQEKYNNLVKQYGVEEAKKRLGDEALANQFQQQSVQERFTQTIEKLKELLVSLVEPLMPVFDVFADIMGIVGPIVGAMGTIVKYAMQLGKYLLPVFVLYKGIQAMQTASLAVNRANYAVKAMQMGQEAFITREKGVQGIMEKQSFLTRVAYNAQLLAGLIREQGIAGIKSYALTLDDKSIAKKIIIKTYDTGSLVMARLKSLFSKQDLATERAGAATRKGSLLTNIGTAAMKAIQSLSSIPVVGWALGLAAAAGTVALGYKFMKGDDVMSEGGYGNRTLLTPKGSISLNNSDTVIAGTNLGGGNNSGGNSPQPQQDNSALIAEMRAMRQETARSNNKPVVVENSMNGTKFGTSVAMNTYKIQ